MVTSPALYLALEGARPLGRGVRFSLAQATELRVNRGPRRAVTALGTVVTLELADPRISGRHARLIRRGVGWFLEDLGSTNGTFLDGALVTTRGFHKVARLLLGTTGFVFDPDERVLPGTPASLDAEETQVLSLRPDLDLERRELRAHAPTTRGVTLVGRRGTGKEILARELHALGGRTGPFVCLVCEDVAEADVKGAAERAKDGTLYLDQADHLDAAGQAALLDAMPPFVIAGTTTPLAASAGFSVDLEAILSGVRHELVPLRDRPMDLGLMVADILPRAAHGRAPQIRLHHDLVQAMLAHPWALDARELDHMLTVALATTRDPTLRAEHVAAALQEIQKTMDPVREADPEPRRGDTKLKDELVLALTETHGNVSEVARRMGRTRMQIHRWMKRWDIDVESYRR